MSYVTVRSTFQACGMEPNHAPPSEPLKCEWAIRQPPSKKETAPDTSPGPSNNSNATHYAAGASFRRMSAKPARATPRKATVMPPSGKGLPPLLVIGPPVRIN